MAMCAPTFSARAVTAVKWLQSRAEQTANFRRLPGAGGLTGCRFTAAAAGPIAGWARAAAPARAARVRPTRRSIPSNCTVKARGDETGSTSWAAGIATAARLAVRSSNGEDWPKLPAADCGTIRYSAESSVDGLAAIVTQPPSEAGSSDVYAPIRSEEHTSELQ